MYKMPPIEKIYEAFSALADNRVRIKNNEANVFSSDNAKEYLVTWKDNTYFSTDNATYWQGYTGYPIIAVLMLQGKLNYNNNYIAYFKSINWKKLNKKYKNKYSDAVLEVLNSLKELGINTESIIEDVNNIYKQLENLKIEVKRGKLK